MQWWGALVTVLVTVLINAWNLFAHANIAIDPVPVSAVFYQPRALQTKVSAINSGHFRKQGSSCGKSQTYIMWLLFWHSL